MTPLVVVTLVISFTRIYIYIYIYNMWTCLFCIGSSISIREGNQVILLVVASSVATSYQCVCLLGAAMPIEYKHEIVFHLCGFKCASRLQSSRNIIMNINISANMFNVFNNVDKHSFNVLLSLLPIHNFNILLNLTIFLTNIMNHIFIHIFAIKVKQIVIVE